MPTKPPRSGDQPLPTAGQRHVVPEVMHHVARFADVMGETTTAIQVAQDINARLALGIGRYGKPLQTHNGRNARRDAYEEVLDALNYVQQVSMEDPAATKAWLWRAQLIGIALDMRKELE